ncbi:hypothetical protein CRM22_011196 [Opisthorchis felineus]|uniref:Retinoblastoma-associated protein A-box domain-containing protein n=1 Tax=Opisthorchis felineus TaxID=147828 RepID=A0A4V3S9D8_OPIFE|nr:hypothetical protein CRM22_011196 [Opisthorchis felineus]TGZ44684.1 hypothetical protein CRM22_011196 [Opisthorchis felineus]
MDFDYEEPIEKRFEDLCQDLCIEGAIREEAWEKYKDVWANYSIDGDQIQWLVCSLYECCRRSVADSISGHVVENAYVSLARLLSAAKMSMVQFFHRIKKWADMTDMVDDMRDRVELLERQFAVSSVIFRNFGRSFGVLFREASYIQSQMHPTGIDLFRLTWLLFIKSRTSFPAVTDDLVNSYHLLVCCLDWVLGAVMVSGRHDLINVEMNGLPKDFLNAIGQNKPWCPPGDEPPCMLRPICEDNEVNYVECKTVKEHFFRSFILRLIEKETIKLEPMVYGSLLESSNFDITLQNLNNSYEEYIIGTGDFDERIYLSPSAAEEIGSAGDSGIHSNLNLPSDLAPSVRRYLLEVSTSGFGGFTETTRRGNANAGAVSRLNGGVNFNNPEARNQNLSQLQILLSGRSKEPSEALVDLVESHCTMSLLADMRMTLDGLVNEFQLAYAGSPDVKPVVSSGSAESNVLAISAAQQRLHLGCILYYLVLENILVDEIRKIEKRLTSSTSVVDDAALARRMKPNLTNLLSQELFHRSLFACCMELVLISSDAPEHHFPWILEALSLDSLNFFKVIEVVVRSIDFPRDMVKYMNQVAELILDSYAWRASSPLWSMLKASGRAPSIEEVIPPEKLERSSGNEFPRTESFVSDARKSSIMPLSGLVLKPGPSPLKQPRLIPSSNTGGLFRTRSMDSGLLPKHQLIGPSEDESAQAAAQLLASGEELGAPTDTNLTSVHTEEINLTGPEPITSVAGNKGTLESGPSETVADSEQSLWSAASNAILSYYPTRHDSLAIFFRHFYRIASARLRDICERLNLQRDILVKIWTGFELCVVHEVELLRDRCLDQILLCSLFGVCKLVLYRPLSFIDIVQVYRMQPQSNRDIYRRVLLSRVTYGRSSGEERGDITRFYNTVFLTRMKDFLQKAASATSADRTSAADVTPWPNAGRWMGPPSLAPLPIQKSNAIPAGTGFGGTASAGPIDITQARRLASNRNVFISPVKHQVNLSPKRVVFTVGRSTGKDLQDVNVMISSAERRASMANLTMGLKRPGSGATVSYVGPVSGTLAVTPASGGAPRTVTLVGPGNFAAKRLELDL